jgi:hypothetical protein
VLKPKLIPFAKQCLLERLGTIIIKDKAPAHEHFAQNQVYLDAGILWMIWGGNSLDLNAIEPAWP